MSWCVLNGIDSRSVQGLIIQSLPPITKPLIRTEVEEIDGRDGDIVTPLGYSAYDKEMTIGLHGNFNIDDVIEYFDSEGKVTFSDEPDKYYLYKIIEAIDFERLIRFRTASVKFHVQPFKYPAVSDTIDAHGNLLTVDDYTATKNDVTVSVVGGVVSVSGTASLATEFFIPAHAVLSDGIYKLKANVTGTADGSMIRVTKNAPNDAESVARYLKLENGETTGDAEFGTYQYLWLYVPDGVAYDYSFDVEVLYNSITAFNMGNVPSKPVITVYGSGNVVLSLNGKTAFALDIRRDYITLDVFAMQAYKGDTYMNRYTSGDYDDLNFKVGTNILSWTGDVSRVVLERYSRWI